MKYIIIDLQGIPTPIIFSTMLQHNQVAGSHKVISAGFVFKHSETHQYVAYGKSVGLNVASRKEDDAILNDPHHHTL
jgi:hypothetical protein